MSRADAPLAVKSRVKVYSPNRHFYALSVLAERKTSVYRATAPRTPLWEMEGYRSILFLADDGQHLVQGYKGGNLLDAHVTPDDMFLTFFVPSRQAGSITVGELFPHLDQLPRTASNITWGNFWGFDSAKRFAIVLSDGRKIVFDADTGKQVNNSR